MIEKVGAVVITYNPYIKGLETLLGILINQFSEILIVDNGSININDIKKISINEKVLIRPLESNLGIAAALNEGMDYFRIKGYEWVATFDQDSEPFDDFVLRFQELSKENVGIIGSYYVDRNWSEKDAERQILTYSDYEETTYVITSGAFVNVRAWNMVGGFDNQLFIDWVDWDINERLVLLGMTVYRTKDLMMRHQVGEPINVPEYKKQILFLNNRLVRDHSPFRQYYIFRNRIIFLTRYRGVNKVQATIKSLIAFREIFILPKGGGKFKAAWKGMLAGLKYDIKSDIYYQKFLKQISD